MNKIMDMNKQQHAARPKRNNTEQRYIVIYGYTHQELKSVLMHFAEALPEYIDIQHETRGNVTTIMLIGVHKSAEILRFNINRAWHNLIAIFPHEVIAKENKSVSRVLGQLLAERELTVACAESCTGGNLAHRIVQVPGSSMYFLGSVVSYSNDVKANVLGVSRSNIDTHGAVSRQVAEEMVKGVCLLMRSDCGIATTGIAGPDGGSRFKPVGTVWIAVKCLDTIVTECVHFDGNRNEVIESATNHAMVMLINLLRNSYIMQEDFNDE